MAKKPKKIGARARWDKAHMVTLSTKLTARRCAEFDQACEAAGVTRYEALRRFAVASIMRPETITRLKWQRGPRKPK